MANALYPPPRPLGVGEVLDLTFRIFRATLLKCLPYAILAIIAGQLPTLYSVAVLHRVAALAEQRDPVWWALYALSAVGTFVFLGAIIRRQYNMASGGGAGGELAMAVRRIPAQLLMLAVLGIWFMPALTLSKPNPALYLLWVPGTLVWLALSCWFTALMLTGEGALASMVRSWNLTYGSWWRLSLIYTVALVLLLVIYALAGVVGLLVALPLAHGDVAVVTAVTVTVVVILSSVGAPFYSAMALVVFGDLAVRREGIDLAQRIAAAR